MLTLYRVEQLGVINLLLLPKIIVPQMVDAHVVQSIFHDAQLLVHLNLDFRVAVQRVITWWLEVV